MNRRTNGVRVVMVAGTIAGLVAALMVGGCVTARPAAVHEMGKGQPKGKFLTMVGTADTDNGFSPLYPIQVTGVMVELTDIRLFTAHGVDGDRHVDFTTIAMPHPTLADGADPKSVGPRTVRFTPFNSIPSLRLQNGIMYMTGRWRVPATLRVKGGRNTMLAGAGSGDGDSGGSGISLFAEVPPPEYQGRLMVWVAEDEEWWFWEPEAGNDSLPIELVGTGAVTSGQIPARSYVRIKGQSLGPTEPFSRVGSHKMKIYEVFEAMWKAASAAGVTGMTPLQPPKPEQDSQGG